MSTRKSNTVTFRLRKIDADLECAIGNIDSATLSDLCRDGLRMALGIRTTKRIEVTERPLAMPVERSEAVNIKSKGLIWRPGQK